MDNWIRSLTILMELEKAEVGGVQPSIEYNKLDNHYDLMYRSIYNSHVYEIDNKMMKVFSTTANEVRPVQLPFDEIFIDARIPFNKSIIYGLYVFGGVDKTRTDEHGEDYYGYEYLITGIYIQPDFDGFHAGFLSLPLYRLKPEAEKLNAKQFGGKDICGTIRRFVMNFNDFLEHPEVKIRFRERTNQKSREKRGKMPLPSSHVINVRGELRIYLNSIAPKPGETEDMSLCYEVAGHWRRFRHPRYTKMQGRKIFIHPFIKGSGVPTVKRRKVSKVET